MYRISRFENFEVNMKHVVENSISGNLCLNRNLLASATIVRIMFYCIASK